MSDSKRWRDMDDAERHQKWDSNHQRTGSGMGYEEYAAQQARFDSMIITEREAESVANDTQVPDVPSLVDRGKINRIE